MVIILHPTLPVLFHINQDAFLGTLLKAREDLYAQGHKGPFLLKHGSSWIRYLEEDYVSPKIRQQDIKVSPMRLGVSLKERIRQVEGIVDVKLDGDLADWDMVLIQR